MHHAEDLAQECEAARMLELKPASVHIRKASGYAAMHDKFNVAEEVTVETGCFYYTYWMEKQNAANVVVIWRNSIMAAEFRALWGQSDAL